MKKMIALLLSLFAVQTALAELPVVTEKLDLEAAKNFAVDRLEGGYSLITVQNGGRFLLIPAGMDAPDGLDADIMPLYMPLDNLFVASTSTVALMDEIGALCAVMLLTLCNASAPMNDVPGVQERFTQWAAVQNEKTVQRLPGSTPEPDSTWAAAAGFDPEAEKQAVKQEAKEETLIAKTETKADVAQTVVQADTSTGFKLYESGQLKAR